MTVICCASPAAPRPAGASCTLLGRRRTGVLVVAADLVVRQQLAPTGCLIW